MGVDSNERCNQSYSQDTQGVLDDPSDDEMMTEQHRRVLQSSRSALTYSMTPEEIVMQLHERRLLTRLEVDMINRKETRQSRAEELLDILERRPDRAFGEFVLALRRTYQPHLARLLLPPSPPKQHSADHREVQAQPSSNGRDVCYRACLRECSPDSPEPVYSLPPKSDNNDVASSGDRKQQLRLMEAEILDIARAAIANLKRHSLAPEALCKEMNKTSKALRNLKKTYSDLRTLLDEGREIKSIDFGSIIFTFTCPSQQSIDSLATLCDSGRFGSLLEKNFVTEELCSKHNLKSNNIYFEVKLYIPKKNPSPAKQRMFQNSPLKCLPTQSPVSPTSAAATKQTKATPKRKPPPLDLSGTQSNSFMLLSQSPRKKSCTPLAASAASRTPLSPILNTTLLNSRSACSLNASRNRFLFGSSHSAPVTPSAIGACRKLHFPEQEAPQQPWSLEEELLKELGPIVSVGSSQSESCQSQLDSLLFTSFSSNRDPTDIQNGTRTSPNDISSPTKTPRQKLSMMRL